MNVKATDFQKKAAESVVTAFKNGRKKYLVADETGLGKTIVARQVIMNLSEGKEDFVVYYFGSNLMLLDDTLEKLGKDTKWEKHDAPQKLGMMIGQARPKGVHIYGFSANLIGESTSKGDDQVERPYFSAFLEKNWEKLEKYVQDHKIEIEDGDMQVIGQFLKRKTVGDREDITPLRKLFERCTLETNPPDLIIFDEFHRYDEVVWEFLHRKLNGGLKWPNMLFLSATPYNYYPSISGYDIAENEVADRPGKIESFEKLLELLAPDLITTYKAFCHKKIGPQCFSSILKGKCIYRNERIADGVEKYLTLPMREDLVNTFRDCYLEEKSIHGFENSRYWKLCSGVYSFPIRVYNETNPDFYKGFIAPEECFDIGDEYFIFDTDQKLKREGFYWNNLRFACIKHYNAEAGRKLLWIPPTMPEYELGGVFEGQKDFSKLMIFSAYKMVPRIISGVFSAYASDDVNFVKAINLSEIDGKMEEVWGDKLTELAERYTEVLNRENANTIDAIKNDLIKKLREYNNTIDLETMELTARYIIGSPYMCAVRVYGAKAAEAIKDAFNIYFEKEGIKQAIFHCGIQSASDLLDYCINGGIGAVLKEYEYAGGSVEALERALVYGSEDKDGANACSQVHVYSRDCYKNSKKPFSIPCHYAERFNADYSDTGKSETNTVAKEHFKNCHNAYNSPFWPMILCTTSANQEGYDLDRYCSRIMHYSLPPNTMAFEQRDGRIDRRLSLLARRRMVQIADSSTLLQKDWSALFTQCPGESGMSPFWTQKDYLTICKAKGLNPLKLERIIPYFPMTAEHTYYRKLLEQKNMYRSRFGMPNESEQGIALVVNQPLKLNDI